MPNINNTQSQLQTLTYMAPHPVFLLNNDAALTIHCANDKFYQFFSLEKQEFKNRYEDSFANLVKETRRTQFVKDFRNTIDETSECDVDIELEVKPGVYELFRLNAYYLEEEDGKRLIYGFVLSLKRRLELMEKYEEQGAYFDVVQDLSKEIIFKIDIKHKTMQHRSDCAEIFGIPALVEDFPESISKGDVIHPEDLDAYMEYARAMAEGIGGIHDVRIKHMTGKYEKYRILSKALNDTQGEPISLLGKLVNIQELTEMEERANYDLLTRTMNKISFQTKVSEILAVSQLTSKHAIYFLDLDDFKNVNDSFGHEFGDYLLETASKRMRNAIREQDIIGRVGGDEFVIFLNACGDEETLIKRGNLMLETIGREYVNDRGRASVKSSIGIAIYPDHGTTYEELYRKADVALYHSKRLGKNTVTIYNEEIVMNK